MNLFSKSLLLLFLLLSTVEAYALNVKALYTSACKRHMGLIVDVDDQYIYFVNLDKGIVKVPRYELIYMADYPTDILPTQKKLTLKDVPLVKVSTLTNHKVEPLLDGWPIGFNAEKIAFLKKNGGETVIDSSNIWSLEFQEKPAHLKSRKKPKDYRFIHPYAFRDCSYSSRGRNVYPQQILSDPVQIKRELDSLQKGFNRIRRYEREQDFYPVPEVFVNQTELGMWFSFGSRSGASDKRSNNLLPVLVDQYSSDVFDYQHYSVTGTAPLFIGTHEEPQSQIYYTFKASYFHFSVMVDPNLVLVGQNYDWKTIDFDPNRADSKSNDVSIVELGFDFGNFSIRAYGGSVLNVGLWDGQNLVAEQFSAPRFGLKYTTHRWWAEANGGSGSKSLDANRGDVSATLLRFNLGLNDLYGMDFVYSFINSTFEAPKVSSFSSDGSIHAFYAYYPFNKRIRLGSFASMESKNSTSTVSSYEDTYFKAGISGFINF